MGWKHALTRPLFSIGFINAAKWEAGLLVGRLRCLSPQNLRQVRRHRRMRNLNIELGAGNDRELDAWVGIDLCRFRSGFRWDVRWGLPLADASVARIHAEQFLCTLEYPDAIETVFRECYRVLQDGGTFRIADSDARKYLEAYVAGDHEFFHSLRGLGGATPPMETEIEVVNQAFRVGGEKRFCYDSKTMERLLRRVGFRDVRETPYDPVRHVDRGDWWRIKESFYLEVTK